MSEDITFKFDDSNLQTLKNLAEDYGSSQGVVLREALAILSQLVEFKKEGFELILRDPAKKREKALSLDDLPNGTALGKLKKPA